MRGRAVEVFEDQGFDGVHAVVDSGGHDEDGEGVFRLVGQAKLCGRAEEEGADVHGGRRSRGEGRIRR